MPGESDEGSDKLYADSEQASSPFPLLSLRCARFDFCVFALLQNASKSESASDSASAAEESKGEPKEPAAADEENSDTGQLSTRRAVVIAPVGMSVMLAPVLFRCVVTARTSWKLFCSLTQFVCCLAACLLQWCR